MNYIETLMDDESKYVELNYDRYFFGRRILRSYDSLFYKFSSTIFVK